MVVITRRYFLVTLGLLLFLAIASPVTVPSKQVSDAEPAQRESGAVANPVSPYEIVRVVNENKKAAEESDGPTPVDLGPIWRTLGIDSVAFDSCSGQCDASIQKSELDGQPQPEVIIKLTQPFNFVRFLVFSEGHSNKSEWIFRGYVDHDFNRYQMASHRVLEFGGKRWLVIRGQEGSGTGFSLYGETWYELGQKGLQAVLRYPIEGHTYPWPVGLGRDFKADIVTRNSAELIINYEVTYTALNYHDRKYAKLFVNRHRACYIWDAGESSFTFSNSCANTSEEEVAAIANIETEQSAAEPAQKIGNTNFYSAAQQRAFVGGGYDVFLKYNFSGLLQIANEKRNPLREWLRIYLNDCLDSPEKKKLELALVNK